MENAPPTRKPWITPLATLLAMAMLATLPTPQVAANPCTQVEDPDAEELCNSLYKCKPKADMTRGVGGDAPYDYSSGSGHTVQAATWDYFYMNEGPEPFIAWVWLNVDC